MFEILESEIGYQISAKKISSDELIIPAFFDGKEIKRIASFNGINVEKIIIEEGIEEIGENAFEDSVIGSITLPKSLSKISKCAFALCKLKTLDLVNVNRIDARAFQECDVTFIPNSNFVYENNVLYNADKTKIICGSTLELVTSAVEIMPFAFYKRGIKSIKINGNVSIGDCAFEDSMLEKAQISGDCELGIKSFHGCKLTDFDGKIKHIGAHCFDKTPIFDRADNLVIIDKVLYKCKKPISSIKVDDNIEIIMSECFKGIESLAKIDLPKNLKTIGSFAFQLTGIKEISIPKSVERVSEGLFHSCRNLDSIKHNVRLIDRSAFFGCEKLKSIELPNQNTIENYTFTGCVNLKRISIPKGVVAIKTDAFKNSGIEKVLLPDSLKIIEQGAFQDCKFLEDFELPTVEEIGNRAFNNCQSLRKIRIPNSVIKMGLDVFGKNPNLTLYIPFETPSSWNDKWNISNVRINTK